MLIDFDEILACAQLIYIYKMYFLNFYQSHRKNWKKETFTWIILNFPFWNFHLVNSNF